MNDYSPPLEDMQFVLFHLAGMDTVAALPVHAEVSAELVDAILREAGHFARHVLAPLNRVGDRIGAQLVDGQVKMPPGFKEAYRQYVDAGWGGVGGPTAQGGQGLPHLVTAAIGEMWKAANLAFSSNFLLTGGAVEALNRHGSPEQIGRYLPKMVSGDWGGVMNLTEPQAGSDLAAITTRALVQADGSYRLHGQKCFITYADNDLVENIVHLVLARRPGAPTGVRGISMFVVSKYLVDEVGRLGARNDVQVLALEKKMGQHASPTCVVLHGQAQGAVAELVGEPEQGIKYIFVMVNAARLAVALEGLGIAERAYQLALEYARTRRQGREVGSDLPMVIARHPDVRRMLLGMKAQIEAMRTVSYVVAAWLDIAKHHPDADERQRHQDRVDLLIPVLKGWMTETGADVASTGIQIHGGAGYVEETGAAQHLRDIRVSAIYEGTTGIQANDLVGRKIARQPGPDILRALIREAQAVAGSLQFHADPRLAAIGRALGMGVTFMSEASEAIIMDMEAAPDRMLGVSVPYLKLFGLFMGGWQMGRAALVARSQLDAGAGHASFLLTKINTVRHYVEHILPAASGLAFTVCTGQHSVLSVDFDIP